ncbi:unnamed protein product [Gordionus sp. m RMFG-2023]
MLDNLEDAAYHTKTKNLMSKFNTKLNTQVDTRSKKDTKNKSLDTQDETLSKSNLKFSPKSNADTDNMPVKRVIENVDESPKKIKELLFKFNSEPSKYKDNISALPSAKEDLDSLSSLKVKNLLSKFDMNSNAKSNVIDTKSNIKPKDDVKNLYIQGKSPSKLMITLESKTESDSLPMKPVENVNEVPKKVKELAHKFNSVSYKNKMNVSMETPIKDKPISKSNLKITLESKAVTDSLPINPLTENNIETPKSIKKMLFKFNSESSKNKNDIMATPIKNEDVDSLPSSKVKNLLSKFDKDSSQKLKTIDTKSNIKPGIENVDKNKIKNLLVKDDLEPNVRSKRNSVSNAIDDPKSYSMVKNLLSKYNMESDVKSKTKIEAKTLLDPKNENIMKLSNTGKSSQKDKEELDKQVKTILSKFNVDSFQKLNKGNTTEPAPKLKEDETTEDKDRATNVKSIINKYSNKPKSKTLDNISSKSLNPVPTKEKGKFERMIQLDVKSESSRGEVSTMSENDEISRLHKRQNLLVENLGLQTKSVKDNVSTNLDKKTSDGIKNKTSQILRDTKSDFAKPAAKQASVVRIDSDKIIRSEKFKEITKNLDLDINKMSSLVEESSKIADKRELKDAALTAEKTTKEEVMDWKDWAINPKTRLRDDNERLKFARYLRQMLIDSGKTTEMIFHRECNPSSTMLTRKPWDDNDMVGNFVNNFFDRDD